MSKSEYDVVEAADVSNWSTEVDAADVVIIGLGCAGVCAAIEAREAGADVLVFERASGGGGVTALAAGHIYLGGGTRVQNAVGVEDTVEDMFTYLMMNTPEPDETKIRLYCEQSVDHFDWLVERGVPFKDTMYEGKHVMQMTDECLIWSGNEEVHPFRDEAKPAPRGHKVAQVGEGGGALMMEKLVAKANALGVRFVYDAHVHQLVRENGKIAGVTYRVFGEDKGSVRAKNAVILAAGQFTQNDEMLAEYLPELLVEGYTRQFTPNDDGAGHQLGKAAGGVLKHMDGALVTAAFYPPESHIKGILVNQEGQRYCAEDSYHSRSSIITTQQPDRKGWLILDEATYQPDPPAWGAYPLVDAFETIEEMEKALGMPDGALQKTMSTYNEHAAKGEDPDFHKKDKWLQPLTQAPYAALDASVGAATYMSFTLGGLDVTIDGEVRTAEGGTVPGLFAIGGCASNIAQDGTGYSSGTCIGESTFFGRRAGKAAASS
ncbi:MAG: FAD-binding protein [Myxococcota bacterium]